MWFSEKEENWMRELVDLLIADGWTFSEARERAESDVILMDDYTPEQSALPPSKREEAIQASSSPGKSEYKNPRYDDGKTSDLMAPYVKYWD